MSSSPPACCNKPLNRIHFANLFYLPLDPMVELAQAIRNKSCVVFAGAGISRDAGLPDWLGMANQLFEGLNGRGLVPHQYPEIIRKLVSDRETFQVGLDTLINVVRRNEVAAELREILKPKTESLVHQALGKLTLKGFVTTNYDRLLNKCVSEEAWKLSNSLADLKLVHSAVNSHDSQFLFKLHGDFDNALPPDDIKVVQGAPILVISSSDYLLLKSNRLDPIRLALHAVLQQYSVMFLGYSMGDPYINEILEFLSEHCQFNRPSWFIGLKNEPVPALPANVSSIQPVDKWDELPQWLAELKEQTNKTTVQAESGPQITPLSKEARNALTSLGEYLHGLETDDLPSKTISSILVPELAERAAIDLPWVCQFVQRILNVGPIWAQTFADRTIQHLRSLKIIEPEGRGSSYKVIVPRIKQIQKRSQSEWEEDRESFFKSIRQRLGKAGSVDESFLLKIDNVLQHLSLGFGKRMAEWIDGGSGRDLGLSHIHELVSTYVSDSEDQRKAEELLGFVFEKPDDEEVGYIYRLLSSSFLLNSVKLDPTAAKFLKDYISDYDLFLDSNVLLPAIIKEHKDHNWVVSLLEDSKKVGCSLFVIEDILNEVYAHRALTETVTRTFGTSRKDLQVYNSIYNERGANCFVQGFLRLPEKRCPTLNEYLNSYSTGKIRSALQHMEVTLVASSDLQTDMTRYISLSATIGEEWERRASYQGGTSHGERPAILNQNEAKQFLYLYHRRAERLSQGSSDNVWFLSKETILEKVFLRDPSTWGKPPTFPVSAWASFLDSRLLSPSRNRRDILNAIMRGNSTSYALPDPVSLVHKSVFGSRVLSKEEAAAIQTVVSDGKLYERLEDIKNVRKKVPREMTSLVELQDELGKAKREVEEELSERLQSEKEGNARRQKEKDERIAHLEKENAVLKGQKRKTPRRKHRK